MSFVCLQYRKVSFYSVDASNIERFESEFAGRVIALTSALAPANIE